MEVFIGDQIKTLAESFILGLIFGAGYDIIRIIHIICGIMSYSGDRTIQRSKTSFVLFLLFDSIYMLLITFSWSVFLYHYNHGVFRLHLFASCICGFILYYQTVGRVVMRLSEWIVRLIKTVVNVLLIRPVKAVVFALWKLFCLIAKSTIGRLINTIHILNRQAYMRKIKRKMPEYLKF
ncbi:MAG: spore cortex biosynthesis protein YabQ [Clostridia bacterium]|nr:spore cortex biosynthesis protein YabQ [Clostridia bacterium]